MSDDNFPATGRIAAVDYGTVRIGVAICDPSRTLASPLENYTRRTPALDGQFFKRLTLEERILGYVVGLPVHTSGRESEKSREARAFGAWLAEITERPVTFHDERYSSSFAADAMADAGFTNKRKKARLDMLAAQQILAAYLERGAGGREDELGDIS